LTISEQYGMTSEMLPAIQHYATTISEPPSRVIAEQVTANVVPKSNVFSTAKRPAEPASYRLDDEAFEILSPVLAPSAINAEAAILARSSLSPKFSHNEAQTKYLRTSSPPENANEMRAKTIDLLA
jgi:hypothetical protein